MIHCFVEDSFSALTERSLCLTLVSEVAKVTQAGVVVVLKANSVPSAPQLAESGFPLTFCLHVEATEQDEEEQQASGNP